MGQQFSWNIVTTVSVVLQDKFNIETVWSSLKTWRFSSSKSFDRLSAWTGGISCGDKNAAWYAVQKRETWRLLVKPKLPVAFIESSNYFSGGLISKTMAGHEAKRWSCKEQMDWISMHMVQKMLKIHSFKLLVKIPSKS